MGGRIKQFRGPSKMPSPVRVLSARTVKLPPRPRERIPLTLWDVSMLSANYIQKGLLFAPPASPPLLSTAHIVDHLAAALADTLATYYPVVGYFVTDQHCDHRGNIIGCSVSIDCHGQGVEIVHADLLELIERLVSPPLRERMLHFSAESLAALKERARQELLTVGDTVGAAALTRFQALSSLMWHCITRARRLAPEGETVCRAAINNRGRLWPALPADYFGNTIYAIGTEAVCASELLMHGHGWAATAVGCTVVAHTDADIQARVAAWMAKPMVYTQRWFDPLGVMMGSSPQFRMYKCDLGWGKAVAARSGKANKIDGKASLYSGQEGGGSMDAELVLTPEHMVVLEQDEEFWVTVVPTADNVLRYGGRLVGRGEKRGEGERREEEEDEEGKYFFSHTI